MLSIRDPRQQLQESACLLMVKGSPRSQRHVPSGVAQKNKASTAVRPMFLIICITTSTRSTFKTFDDVYVFHNVANICLAEVICSYPL